MHDQFALPPREARIVAAGILLVCALISCNHRIRTVVPQVSPSDDFTDLAAGEHLRIVVPLLKSGRYRPDARVARTEGNTIVLSADDLLGYELYRYSVESRRKGRVFLKLDEAEVSKEGKTVVDVEPPALPFPLPQHAQHIRLIYLVRSSRSDHNMAIAAAGNLDALNVFTSRMKADPAVCDTAGKQVSCTWVPLGIALRPESP